MRVGEVTAPSRGRACGVSAPSRGQAKAEGLKSLARETVQGTEEGDNLLPQVVRQDNQSSEGLPSLVFRACFLGGEGASS